MDRKDQQDVEVTDAGVEKVQLDRHTRRRSDKEDQRPRVQQLVAAASPGHSKSAKPAHTAVQNHPGWYANGGFQGAVVRRLCQHNYLKTEGGLTL